MYRKRVWIVISLVIILSMALAGCAKKEAAPVTFGILMVGPYNDHGWSQAHYEAGLYVEKNWPGSKMRSVPVAYGRSLSPKQAIRAWQTRSGKTPASRRPGSTMLR